MNIDSLVMIRLITLSMGIVSNNDNKDFYSKIDILIAQTIPFEHDIFQRHFIFKILDHHEALL